MHVSLCKARLHPSCLPYLMFFYLNPLIFLPYTFDMHLPGFSPNQIYIIDLYSHSIDILV